MSLVKRNKLQTVTYWAPDSLDVNGKVAFTTPVTFKARWEDKSELFTDPQGREIRSQAIVYTARDVVIDGYLYLGVTSSSDPTTISGAKEIKNFSKSPTLKVTGFERKAIL